MLDVGAVVLYKNGEKIDENKTKEKYWLAKNGLVRCPNDDCPEECSLDCPIHLQTLALEFLDKNDVAQAVSFLLKAVELEPSFADAWNNLAACYGQMGEHQEAMEAYSHAIRYCRKPDTLYGLTVEQKELGNYSIALSCADMYVAEFGKDSRISSLMDDLGKLQIADQINNEYERRF